MKLTFIGATHEVTGSCYFLEAAGKKFLVDCGMEQGPDQYENQEIPVALSDVDFALLTMLTLTTPATSRWLMQKDSGDLFMRQMLPAICVTLCSVTVRISRCLRLSGATVRHRETDRRILCRHILWKMLWV